MRFQFYWSAILPLLLTKQFAQFGWKRALFGFLIGPFLLMLYYSKVRKVKHKLRRLEVAKIELLKEVLSTDEFFFKWSSEYSVNTITIDDQHQE